MLPLMRPCRHHPQPEFLAAVREVAASLEVVLEKRPELVDAFRMMCEPERQARPGPDGGGHWAGMDAPKRRVDSARCPAARPWLQRCRLRP